MQRASMGLRGSADSKPTGQASMQTCQICVQVVPSLSKPLDQAALARQCEAEGRRDDEATGFTARAREWWAEYIAGGPDFQSRVVKLLAYAEDGMQVGKAQG